MIPVSTLDDPRLADYRTLGTPDVLRVAGLFVAEGRLVVRRLLLSADVRTRSILVTHAAWREMDDVLAPASSAVPVYVVAQDLMNAVVGFNIHRGCLAIAERPVPRQLPQFDLASARRVLVLEGVNNPDNIGGLFRSAAAFGVDVVILGPGCGDPLYRKAVRTSMGAALAVPFVESGPWPDAIQHLSRQGFTVVALTPRPGAQALAGIRPDLPCVAVLAGAEGTGLSEGALAVSTLQARIPTTTRVDSLNVATAAAIALHHFFR